MKKRKLGQRQNQKGGGEEEVRQEVAAGTNEKKWI